MLELLGVTAAEERLYEDLLIRPGSTAGELASVHPSEVLAALVSKQLVREAGGRYTAVPPELALRSGLDAQRLELERAAARVQQLERLHRATPQAGRRVPVEAIPGDEAVGRIGALHAAAQVQVRAFDTPPYGKVLEPSDAQMVDGAVVRGVKHRIIYARAAVDELGLATMRAMLAAGEDARVVGEVPLRLTIFDDAAAAMPIRAGRPQTDGVLVVWPCSLLDALIALFEQVWVGALPLFLEEPAEEASEDDDRTLVALLAAGMGDQAIARQLGISLRTVGRRVRRVQNTMNAATRFQAGVAVGLARAAETGG